MKFKEDREQFLVEAMGGAFIRINEKAVHSSLGYMSEWEWYGCVLTWAKSEPWWGHIKRDVIGAEDDVFGPLLWGISEYYVEPETFIEAVYRYLAVKEMES